MKAYFAKEVLTEQGPRAAHYLLVEQDKIAGIVADPPGNIPIVTYEDCILAPGFIDVHTHGALGYETGYGEIKGLLQWSEFALAHGVTGLLPSSASLPLEKIRDAARDIREVARRPFMNVLGLHMEGPFFAAGPKIGAQNPQHVRTEFSREFRDFIGAYRDVIKYIAVDPALESVPEIVPYCTGLGIRVAAGHSGILNEDFQQRKKWGFSSVTHTFNGMAGLDHRNPGLAYAACMDRDLYAEIICDGHHVSYPMIQLFLRLKGFHKAVLITDSLPATGVPPGDSSARPFTLGGIEFQVTADGKALKPDGGLAGSVLTLDQAVRNLVQHLGVPLHEAVYMASTAPAGLLGLDACKGSLHTGKDADFIVLDSALKVVATYLKGRNVFTRPPQSGHS